jgi:hypothetical protein
MITLRHSVQRNWALRGHSCRQSWDRRRDGSRFHRVPPAVVPPAHSTAIGPIGKKTRTTCVASGEPHATVYRLAQGPRIADTAAIASNITTLRREHTIEGYLWEMARLAGNLIYIGRRYLSN